MRAQSVSAGGARSRVAGGDRGLQRVRAERAAELLGALERGETATDEELIPARAVLIEEQDRLSRRADARPRARRLDLHQRDEAVDLGLLRDELGQDAPEPQRVLAERGPHPVVAGRRRVALVEDEVDDLEHRRQTRGKLGPAGDLEGDARLGERPLGPDDALGDRRLRDEERARDLVGRQTAEQAERERDARLGREDRMAGREHEAQQVVADVVVDGGVEVRRGHLLLGLELATELLVLALEPLASAQEVDRAMLRGGHEPGARVVRDARLRPLLERGDERILREVLGETDVAHDPREAGDEPGGLDPPDRVDRAMGIGSRHGHRLDHLRSASARPRCAAITLRGLSRVCAGVLGRNAGAKSDASNTWRISNSPLPSTLKEARHPFDRLILRLHLEQREAGDQLLRLGERPVDHGDLPSGETERAPFELGWSPSAASITPAFTISSLNFPISSMSSWSGERPPRTPCRL